MYSQQILCADVTALSATLYSQETNLSTVLLGHSLGGAVAIRTAVSIQIANLEGLIVIDVVEGTALGEFLSSLASGVVTHVDYGTMPDSLVYDTCQLS